MNQSKLDMVAEIIRRARRLQATVNGGDESVVALNDEIQALSECDDATREMAISLAAKVVAAYAVSRDKTEPTKPRSVQKKGVLN